MNVSRISQVHVLKPARIQLDLLNAVALVQAIRLNQMASIALVSFKRGNLMVTFYSELSSDIC